MVQKHTHTIVNFNTYVFKKYGLPLKIPWKNEYTYSILFIDHWLEYTRKTIKCKIGNNKTYIHI